MYCWLSLALLAPLLSRFKDMQIDEDMISNHLREHDRNRYLASLLMGDDVRLPISVLFAFNAEISRIRELIREPLPGEIRLQWWREVTADNARKDEASANPLADALNQVIDTYNINRSSFDGYCRSRIFDLYDDPMPDKLTYEGYCGETASTLLQWCCQIIDQEAAKQSANACGHAGIAQSVAGHLVLLPQHISRGQVYIPIEILSAHGIDRDSFLSNAATGNIDRVINDFADYGAMHLEKAREEYRLLPKSLKQVFLPLASCSRVYKKAKAAGAKALAVSAATSSLKSHWDLWQSQRKGMF